jgi:hypothetical protein
VNLLTPLCPLIKLHTWLWRMVVCNMESRFDITTIASAVGVAAYLAIAVGYVAHYQLGFSLQEIRGAAVLIAVAMGSLVAIDFFDTIG